jgi:hypothetical protein
MPTAAPYPIWKFYPSNARPPAWVNEVLGAFAQARPTIESNAHLGLTSDAVLRELRPFLTQVGFEVEAGKKAAEKIRRPVYFGELGREGKTYEIDGFHDEHGIALEVEAGRGARGNAVYRDLIEASLLVDARYLVLGVMAAYRHQSAGKTVTVASYTEARDLLDAVYASGRLQLPLDGVLLVGY